MKDSSQENDKKPKPYDPPKVVAVSLRPDEAVLGHCKISGSAGPASASCRSLACKSLGS